MAAVWLRRVVLAAFIVLAFVPASAFAATMDYLGTWSSSTTYATGKVVKHNGGIFYSLKSTNSAPNRNKPPGSSPTWWEKVGAVEDTTLSGTRLTDANGAVLGRFLFRNMFLIYRGGRAYEAHANFDGLYNEQGTLYFSGMNCAGQAYAEFKNLSGFVFFAPSNWSTYNTNGEAKTGTLYYAIAPFSDVNFASWRDGDGTCSNGVGTVFGGIATSEVVNLSTPLKVE